MSELLCGCFRDKFKIYRLPIGFHQSHKNPKQKLSLKDIPVSVGSRYIYYLDTSACLQFFSSAHWISQARIPK